MSGCTLKILCFGVALLIGGASFAEPVQRVDLPPLEGDRSYRGTLSDGDRDVQFETKAPWIIIPPKSSVKKLDSVAPDGMHHVPVTPPEAHPVPDAAPPPPPPAPEPQKAAEPPEEPEEAPVKKAPEPPRKKRPEGIVAIEDYQADWHKFGGVSLSLGWRKESVKGSGGVSDYQASHAVFPLSASLENTESPRDLWHYGLILTHAAYKEKTKQSATDGETSFPERNETIGLDRQQVFARRRLTEIGAPRGLATPVVGLALRLEQAQFLEAADTSTGAAQVVHRGVAAVTLDLGIDHAFTKKMYSGLLVSLAPDATTIGHQGTVYEERLSFDAAVAKETWLTFILSSRQTHWTATFPCPTGLADCKKTAETKGSDLGFALGARTSVYVP